jgi:hypothetical protein
MNIDYILKSIEIILLILILAALRKRPVPATRKRASKKKVAEARVPPQPRYRARVPDEHGN